MEPFSPEELVRWCQQTLPDDTRAFEVLLARYKERVYATAYRLMGNRQDAEDQAQEVFLKIFRSIKHLEEPATLTTWIYRITTNTCFDALNKQQRRPATTSFATEDDEERAEARFGDAQGSTPEKVALRNELRQCLEKTLKQLDAVERGVIVLRDLEERSYQEIAEMLSLGLSAVKMRIHRARLAFQKLLDQVCPGVRRRQETAHLASSRTIT